MKFVKRARTCAALLAVGLAACTAGVRSDSEAYKPPPPLALVALVDPSSGQMPAQLQQLETVIRSSATPNEAVVVMLLSAGLSDSYAVRSGESLSAIAAAHGITLSELEAVNPQLGPVSGRNWSVIHPGEHVTLPDRSAPNPLVLVSRAPAGPSPPALVRLPQEPSNPTDYQRAQYQHALVAANTTNASRIAAWQASVAQALAPWQSEVAAQLESKAASAVTPSIPANAPALSTSLGAGLTTLGGLNGRRLLLLLGGGQAAPSALAPGSLTGINLVVANVADPGAAAAWSAAAKSAGAASVNALDPALTQLQLAQIVNK